MSLRRGGGGGGSFFRAMSTAVDVDWHSYSSGQLFEKKDWNS